jgi:threonine/homoserine/homoserine lactone efflux protein
MNVDIISTLGWIVLFISVGGGIYLGYDGYGGYRKYREISKSLNETKRAKTKPEVEKELPKPIQEEPEEKQPYAS